MIGVPEKVVLDWVGVILAEEAVAASSFLLLLLAKAIKMITANAKRAMTPTVMLLIVTIPMEALDSLTDLA
jgi:hypothetical protein